MNKDSEPLTQEQELFARVMFQNRILRSNGQRYEDLFIDVMTKKDSRFRPVKPQGKFGDEGKVALLAQEYYTGGMIARLKHPEGYEMLSRDEKEKLLRRLRRLRRIEGQVAGLARMVEADKYCIDVIQQVSAAQGALSRVSQELLDSHLRTCLVTAFKSKDARERDRMVKELVALFAKTSRQ